MKQDRIVGLQLDEKVLAYQRHHPGVPYDQALAIVMADDAEAAKEYVQEFSHVSNRQAKQFGLEDAGLEDSGTIAAEKEIDRLTLAYMQEHPTMKDYAKALEIVLARHPDLKMVWLKKYSPGVSFSKDFAQVVTVEHDEGDKTEAEKKAAAKVDAMVKEIKAKHPDWDDAKCIAEAKKRLAAVAAENAEIAEEVKVLQNALDSAA